MKRRSFVKSSLLSTAAAGVLPMIADATNKKEIAARQEFYELRVYTFKNAEQLSITENYFEKAAIPALNRLGSKHVGVFRELKPGDQPKLYVIVPFQSLDNLIGLQEKMLQQPEYIKAASAYLDATAAAPAYERFETSLLKAFSGMPSLVAPQLKARIFELRRYESPTEMAGKKKIDMFNDKGEIAIFKRVGLTPVFFGETLVGGLQPNLTYMLTYDDMDAHDKSWKAFGGDADWKRIKALPGYGDADIVSHITSTFLVPATGSQI